MRNRGHWKAKGGYGDGKIATRSEATARKVHER